MKLTKRLNLTNSENGFASLVIAAILVVVLGLLTVGFAELMRNNQIQELNQHLSDQAYYAAESGVNDAVAALNHGYQQTKDFCGPYDSQGAPATNPSTPGEKYLTDNTVNVADSQVAQWTCLLITPYPSTLQYNPVDTVTPTTFIIEPVDTNGKPTTLPYLNIYWAGADGSKTTFRSGGNVFPPSNSGNASPNCSQATNWCAIGALRFSITPLTSLGDAPIVSPSGGVSISNMQTLVSNTYNAFMYPNSDSSSRQVGSDSYSGNGNNGLNPVAGSNTGFSSSAGSILSGQCNSSNTPLYCGVQLKGLTGTCSGNTACTEYLVTLRSIYDKTNVVIQGPSGVHFAGAQTVVDSTGRSQNVLRRIQVRVPDKNNFAYPGFDAEATGSICKNLSAYPGTVTMDNC